MKRLKLMVVTAATSALSGCVTLEPFPENLETGMAQVSNSEPNCFPYEKNVEEGVYLKTYCAGFYPPSLSDNGVEGKCGARLDILPDGSTKVHQVACNVGRDIIVRRTSGGLTESEHTIARQMFKASTLAAIKGFEFILDPISHPDGRANTVFPMDFFLEGGGSAADALPVMEELDDERVIYKRQPE